MWGLHIQMKDCNIAQNWNVCSSEYTDHSCITDTEPFFHDNLTAQRKAGFRLAQCCRMNVNWNKTWVLICWLSGCASIELSCKANMSRDFQRSFFLMCTKHALHWLVQVSDVTLGQIKQVQLKIATCLCMFLLTSPMFSVIIQIT